jgi:hypothetical protein
VVGCVTAARRRAEGRQGQTAWGRRAPVSSTANRDPQGALDDAPAPQKARRLDDGGLLGGRGAGNTPLPVRARGGRRDGAMAKLVSRPLPFQSCESRESLPAEGAESLPVAPRRRRGQRVGPPRTIAWAPASSDSDLSRLTSGRGRALGPSYPRHGRPPLRALVARLHAQANPGHEISDTSDTGHRRTHRGVPPGRRAAVARTVMPSSRSATSTRGTPDPGDDVDHQALGSASRKLRPGRRAPHEHRREIDVEDDRAFFVFYDVRYRVTTRAGEVASASDEHRMSFVRAAGVARPRQALDSPRRSRRSRTASWASHGVTCPAPGPTE